MCGIVGYLGKQEAYPILMNGLRRLEYRGYDSAGLALMNGDLNLYKTKGKVDDLENFVSGSNITGSLGIAHTRWATHGEPNSINAHPHQSQSKDLALIHNGIIENYATLKAELINRGHVFESKTDSEVLIHLIEDIQKNEKLSLGQSIRMALKEVIGAYAIVVISKSEPGAIYAAKKSSPLVVGMGQDEYFLASDATPIIEYTDEVVYLNDEELVKITLEDGLKIRTIQDVEITPYIQKLEMSLNSLEKGGYDHFMLKEIYEQPSSIADCLRGRIHLKENLITMGGIAEYLPKIMDANRIIIVACGTSWHAALVAEYLFEDLARIPVEVEYASEFRYRNPIITDKDVVIAISQSGETADTLAAIEIAKERGATILGICNVIGSTIARVAHAGAYTHAGPEIGVASTKAFTAQVAVLSLIALNLGLQKGHLTAERFSELLHELNEIPKKVERALECDSYVKHISEIFKYSPNFLYLGRGYNFPVALEGALKLKEISYIHAEGYPAAEMKHGPIALIDTFMPTVVIATNKDIYEKVLSNIEEIKARKGVIIAVVREGDTQIRAIADYIIEVPETEEFFVPIVNSIPLQLLSYHIAVMRSCDVDMPRNLAKSVTVE